MGQSVVPSSVSRSEVGHSFVLVVRLVYRSFVWSVGHSVDPLVGRSLVRSVGFSVVGTSFVRLVGRSIVRSIDRSIDRSFGIQS